MTPNPQKELPVRYVVLHHTGIEPEHFDLMIQLPGAEQLMTWRILTPPETWAKSPPQATRLPDHRLTYLTYEGHISGNRGTVKRVVQGEAAITSSNTYYRLRLSGESGYEIQLPA